MKLKELSFFTKGAEASISTGKFLNCEVIIKHRLPKTYRHLEIDTRIRLLRIRTESKCMTLAWKLGVNVPCLMGINLEDNLLIMEKVLGEVLYNQLTKLKKDFLLRIFTKLGEQVGLLHNHDIIHGDLTVFNVIIPSNLDPYIIDFGLSKIDVEVEAKADDLLTFYSTLKAISFDFTLFFESFMKGYYNSYSQGKKTFEQMKKIQSRARYIAKEDRL
ncbi:MAG: KEOPS complex kinase/ATPase Bud32 [Candidatus Hodarchaeales archaeon]|jgi:N6-L-threonylcarbamoyladenine synthase/protein kinase Bud32